MNEPIIYFELELRIPFPPFSKEVIFISDNNVTFHIKILQNISQKPLEEECNCSLLPPYLGRNKEAIILHPYYMCQCTEPFLLTSFTLL